jgi:hypothetical protein
MQPRKFHTALDFTRMVEETVSTKNVPYIDAVLLVCKETRLDPEDVADLLTPAVVDKLAEEGAKLNIIKKPTFIPFV